jgi:YesN/AraC family two-component response regulator
MDSSNNKPRILLVDDEPHSLLLLQETLREYQLSISEARNGQQAIQYAQQKQPDLVLMDINMPVMDGISVCKTLKTTPETAAIPVIFLTSHNDISCKIRAFTSGCVDYITKPFHAHEVIARVALHLGHTAIINNLAAHQKTNRQPTPSLSSGGDSPAIHSKLVADACDILLANIISPPKLDELAAQLGTNREYLNTAFRNALGFTPFAWLREERMRQAALSLKETDRALKQIAYDCGYNSPASFITGFKQRFGVTPHEFRHQQNQATGG